MDSDSGPRRHRVAHEGHGVPCPSCDALASTTVNKNGHGDTSPIPPYP